jgi:hypothetical protein
MLPEKRQRPIRIYDFEVMKIKHPDWSYYEYEEYKYKAFVNNFNIMFEDDKDKASEEVKNFMLDYFEVRKAVHESFMDIMRQNKERVRQKKEQDLKQKKSEETNLEGKAAKEDKNS